MQRSIRTSLALVGADACRDAAFGASLGGNAVMPDGSAGTGGAAGLHDDDKGDGDECEDGFHNHPFARRGLFVRMILRQCSKKRSGIAL